MACPAVFSGASFLGSSLAFIDCQAQSIGTFGFQALSAPNSTGATVLLGLLTLFIVIFGYRLLFGYAVEGRDVVAAVLKIGIVLTLATSWPAFRTIAYDTVLYGPGQVAAQITGVSALSSGRDLVSRLQDADSGIVALTVAGTGRYGDDPSFADPRAGQPATLPNRAAFATVAVDDSFGMGFARVTYLAGTLAPLAVLRVGAGLLLALAPLFVGLLLFEGTRNIFFGWVRALVAVALGSLAMIVSLSIELALLEPWLADVLARREARLLAPEAPTELVVITMSFAVVALGLVALFARLAFSPGAATTFVRSRIERVGPHEAGPLRVPAFMPLPAAPSRAEQVAERLTTIYRGERRLEADWSGPDGALGARAAGGRAIESAAAERSASAAPVPLGASYRRTTRRTSRMISTRDRRS